MRYMIHEIVTLNPAASSRFLTYEPQTVVINLSDSGSRSKRVSKGPDSLVCRTGEESQDEKSRPTMKSSDTCLRSKS